LTKFFFSIGSITSLIFAPQICTSFLLLPLSAGSLAPATPQTRYLIPDCPLLLLWGAVAHPTRVAGNFLQGEWVNESEEVDVRLLLNSPTRCRGVSPGDASPSVYQRLWREKILGIYRSIGVRCKNQKSDKTQRWPSQIIPMRVWISRISRKSACYRDHGNRVVILMCSPQVQGPPRRRFRPHPSHRRCPCH